MFTVLETPEQGEFGSSCQVHFLQSQWRDGFHWHGERRVHCPAGQLSDRVGQEERPQRHHPGHKVTVFNRYQNLGQDTSFLHFSVAPQTS